MIAKAQNLLRVTKDRRLCSAMIVKPLDTYKKSDLFFVTHCYVFIDGFLFRLLTEVSNAFNLPVFIAFFFGLVNIKIFTLTLPLQDIVHIVLTDAGDVL